MTLGQHGDSEAGRASAARPASKCGWAIGKRLWIVFLAGLVAIIAYVHLMVWPWALLTLLAVLAAGLTMLAIFAQPALFERIFPIFDCTYWWEFLATFLKF